MKLSIDAITNIEDKPNYDEPMAVIRFILPDFKEGEILECGEISLPNEVWSLFRATIIDGIGLFQDNEIDIKITELTYDEVEELVTQLEKDHKLL